MFEYWDTIAGDYNCQSTYMPECSYPVDCPHTYGHSYHSIYPQPQLIGVGHDIGMGLPIMYPEIYYKIYPYASQICDKIDNPYVLYPSEKMFDKMVDDCYDLCISEIPELEEYAGKVIAKAEDASAKRRGRRPLLRDLVAIILLSELFRRRRLGPGIWSGDYHNYTW